MYPDYRDQNKLNPPRQHPLAIAPPESVEIHSSEKPERGGCLILWLVISAGFSVLALLPFLQLVGIVSTNRLAAQRISPVMVLAFGSLILLYLGSLWGMWKWKRQGVYGIVAATIISPFFESGLGTANASDFIAPFIQLSILYFLIKDKWDYFD